MRCCLWAAVCGRRAQCSEPRGHFVSRCLFSFLICYSYLCCYPQHLSPAGRCNPISSWLLLCVEEVLVSLGGRNQGSEIPSHLVRTTRLHDVSPGLCTEPRLGVCSLHVLFLSLLCLSFPVPVWQVEDHVLQVLRRCFNSPVSF